MKYPANMMAMKEFGEKKQLSLLFAFLSCHLVAKQGHGSFPDCHVSEGSCGCWEDICRIRL